MPSTYKKPVACSKDINNAIFTYVIQDYFTGIGPIAPMPVK